MKRLFKKTGFTIVELVIVIAVIAVLAAVLIPTFSSVIDKANESAALQEATNAYKEYVVENAATGKILDDLYVEVDNGYIHYQNGEAVKADNGKYVVTEIPDEAYVVPYTLAVFSFGENGEANHKDGNNLQEDINFTENGYTLTFTSMNKVYGPAYDAKGNSCIKLGSGSNEGSFSFVVPEEVAAVKLYVAGYKNEIAKLKINTSNTNGMVLLSNDGNNKIINYTTTTISDNGQYTSVTIDTTTEKTITCSTLSGGYRCMINAIKYLKSNIAIDNNDDTSNNVPNDSNNDFYTINFDDTSKRVEYTNSIQVWKENNIIVTNNKTSDSSPIADHANPARFYAKSVFKLELENGNEISKIEVVCYSTEYSNSLKDTLEKLANANVVVNGTKVSISFADNINILNITLLEQVRIHSITVYYDDSSNSNLDDNHIHTEVVIKGTPATCTNTGLTDGSYCSVCGVTLVEQNVINKLNHTINILPSIDATCTTTGLTEGEECSECGEILVAQEVIPTIDHVYTNGICSCGKEKTNNSFVKITDNLEDWSGVYLIVYETDKLAFNGNLNTLDAVNNNIEVVIDENEIEVTEDLLEMVFIIEKINNEYSIRSNSGYYIGQTSDTNGLKTSTSDKYSNTISINDDDTVDIISKGTHLRFNNSSNQNRFRYYKSDTYTSQKAITLYKLSCNDCSQTEIILNAVSPTCTETGLTEGKKCSVCGKITVAQEEVAANGHSFSEGKCTVCGVVDPNHAVVQPETPVEIDINISFADKAKRTEFDTSKQVWVENGITVTNNKADSSNNVADYAKPARFYASSELVVEAANITKIVFDCNNSSYANALKNSIIGYNVTVSSDKVTVEFATPVNSFTIAKLSGQVRMDSITVTYIGSAN